jgi:hypothetical protein
VAEPYSYQPSLGYDKPQMVGGNICTARDSAPASRDLVEGRINAVVTDEDGTQFVHPHGPQIWSFSANPNTIQANTVVHASPGAGLSLYVTDIYVSMAGAAVFNLEDSTSVFLWAYQSAALGDGAKDSRFSPLKLVANRGLQYDLSANVQTYITISGYIAP